MNQLKIKNKAYCDVSLVGIGSISEVELRTFALTDSIGVVLRVEIG